MARIIRIINGRISWQEKGFMLLAFGVVITMMVFPELRTLADEVRGLVYYNSTTGAQPKIDPISAINVTSGMIDGDKVDIGEISHNSITDTGVKTHPQLDAVADTVTAKWELWDSTAADSHTHANKPTLDGIAADSLAAWNAAVGGVGSFNSRTGAVTPQAGDYTAAMVTGAVADTDGRLSDARAPTAHDQSASTITSGILDSDRLGNSGVTAGSYTAANITLDAHGFVTAAANGSAGSASDSDFADWTSAGVSPSQRAAKAAIDAHGIASSADGIAENGYIVSSYYASSGTDTGTIALDDTEGGFAGYSIRIVIPNSVVPRDGATVAITFKSGGGALTVKHASIGVQTGGAGSMATADTPTELKFGGASGFTIVGAGGTITSDDLTFAVDKTGGEAYIVIIDISNTAGQDNLGKLGTTGHGETYYGASEQYLTASPPGGGAYNATRTYAVTAMVVTASVSRRWDASTTKISDLATVAQIGGKLDTDSLRSGANITYTYDQDSGRLDLSGTIPAANIGVHTQDASTITQTEDYRFVTDAEKWAWDAKQGALSSGSGAGVEVLDGSVVRTLADGANISWSTFGDSNRAEITGNIHIGNMPTGGSWALTSNLDIDNSTLYVDQTNNKIGIGTTVPNAYNASANNLVVASAGNTGITIASGETGYGSIYFADGTSGDSEYEGYVQYNHNTNELLFGVNHASAVKINSAGFVGIGVTPTNPLTVVAADGVVPSEYALVVKNLESTAGQSSGVFVQAGSNASDLPINVNDYSNSVGLLRLSGAGILTLPQLASGDLTSASGVITSSSDARLKEAIDSKSYGIDTVKKLKPRHFKWKSSGKEDYGFFAQEAGAVIPEALGEPATPGGMYGLYDRPIIAALVNAVQEQQTEIDELKSRLKQVEDGR